VRDYARKNGIDIEQAQARLMDVRCEVCGAAIDKPVGRRSVCGPKDGERRSGCQLTKHLAGVSGISISEAKRRRQEHHMRRKAARQRDDQPAA
jgi:hypothetical protein